MKGAALLDKTLSRSVLHRNIHYAAGAKIALIQINGAGGCGKMSLHQGLDTTV